VSLVALKIDVNIFFKDARALRVMPIKIDKKSPLVFFVLTCVWNIIKKEGSPIYFRKKNGQGEF